MSEEKHPLEKLREKFPDHQISKLPKETGAQAKQRKQAQEAGNWPKKCEVCGGYHHERAVHLDYVGHAALTDRLLDTDMEWTWEPVAFNQHGLPAIDQNGGMWIKLTVCGVTRMGYGSADGKTGGDAVKEIIGDALRNAAMRFGAALDLWHKGDLHLEEPEEPQFISAAQVEELKQLAKDVGANEQGFFDWCNVASWERIPAQNYMDARNALEAKRSKKKKADPQRSEELDDTVPHMGN